MAECCCWCLVATLVKQCLRKTTVYTSSKKHLCMCHSDTCRQNEHSLSHYQAFVETSCQVETHRSLLQMLQTISLNSQSEGNGMSASISIRGKRKYLRGKAFKLNFWLWNQLFCHSPLQFELIICCQCCQWRELTLIRLKISGCLNSKTIGLHPHVLFITDEGKKSTSVLHLL